MQWYDATIQNLRPDMKYTRQQLISLLREDAPSLNEGSYQWAVGGMLKSGVIIRTGFDEYMMAEGNTLPEYEPFYSTNARELISKLSEEYPYVDFTVFETVLLNDFLTHLIAQNTIFIQAEKDISAFIFRFLQEESSEQVMYKPSAKDMELYWTERCIVVTDLVSEAPLSANAPHSITMEKMLVDIFCDKLIRSTYSKGEYPTIVKQAMKAYRVEKPKMIRYARRRNKAAEIEKIILNIEGE